MASVVVSETYIVIAAIIAVSLVAGAVLAGLQEIRAAQLDMLRGLKQKMRVGVEIVFAAGSENSSEIKVWVKNTGSTYIPAALIGQSDVYAGPVGNVSLIPYDPSGSALPSWSYKIANDDGDGRWDPGETVEVTIRWWQQLSPGDYYVRFVAYTGSYDECYFSV